MSYNDSESAKDLTGVEINNALLDVAQAIIHNWTQFRWEATAIVKRFSGNNNRVVFLRYPITSWTSLKEIDQQNDTSTTLTRYNDYDVDEKTGKLDISGGTYNRFFPEREYALGGRFLRGYNNYEVSYTYNYTITDVNYPIVKYIEAAIGLEIKKNPLLLKTVNLTGGDKVDFGDNGIRKLLINIPRGKGIGRKN